MASLGQNKNTDPQKRVQEILAALPPEATVNREILRGTNHAAKYVVDRILIGVHQTSPGREGEVLEILKRSVRDWGLISLFLKQMGTDDYFAAVSRCRCQFPVLGKDYKEVGKGAKGRQFKSAPYFLFNNQSQVTSRVEALGFQGLVSILNGFRDDLVRAADHLEKSRKQRSAKGTKTNTETEILELMRDFDALDRFSGAQISELIVHETEHYKELRKLVEDSKLALYKLKSGDQLFVSTALNTVLKDYIGGQWIGEIERREKENPDTVPEWVKAHLKILKTGSVEDPQTAESYRIVRLYSLSHTRVSKEAAFAPVAEDISFLRSLPESHALFQVVSSKAVTLLLTEFEDLLNSAPDSVTLFEMARVVSSLPIGKIRRTLNAAVLEHWRGEFSNGMARFTPLYAVSETELHSDSRTDTLVPQRLKTHLYIAPLGADRQKVLSFDDLRLIKEAVTLKTLFGLGEATFEAKNCADFLAMVRGVCIASRKVDALEMQLAEIKPEVDINIHSLATAGGQLGKWKGIVLGANEYLLEEDITGRPHLTNPLRSSPITLAEMISKDGLGLSELLFSELNSANEADENKQKNKQIAIDRKTILLLRKEVDQHRKEHELAAKVGLFPANFKTELLTWQKYVGHLYIARRIPSIVQCFRTILEYPLVHLEGRAGSHYLVNNELFMPADVRKMVKLARTLPHVEKLGLPSSAAQYELLENLRPYLGRLHLLLDHPASEHPELRAIALYNMPPFPKVQNGITFTNIQEARDFQSTIEGRKMKSAREVPDLVLRRIVYDLRRLARGGKSVFGIIPSADKITDSKIRIDQHSPVSIDQQLIERVESVSRDWFGATSTLLRIDGKLIVNFGMYRGIDLGVAIKKDRGYFDWVVNGIHDKKKFPAELTSAIRRALIQEVYDPSAIQPEPGYY